MKGYVILSLFALLIVLTVPFCAFSPTPSSPQNTPLKSEDAVPPTTQAEAVFKVRNEKTDDIVTLDEQTFLTAIVACEMGAAAPQEALKAQAVAAYTYYTKQRSAAKDGMFSNVPPAFFEYCTTQGMQSKWGDAYERNLSAIQCAIDAVKGKLLLYDDQPITACYHAISAGLTEKASDVWGGEYPYLIPVDSAGDLSAAGYETTASFTPDELKALLQKENADFSITDSHAATWFSAPETTDSGFVKSINIGGTAFKGTAVRTALSLRSACFTVRYTNDRFVFTVRGYGHNVGMSQTGAKYMANNGASFEEILSHYYPGTILK